MSDKPLLLFVGKSASGKTTIANMLEERLGMSQVQSYTTREPRFKGETGHIFVSKDDFPGNDNIVAYTKYNDNEYWTTPRQLEEADIYVIDVDGVKTLLQNKDKVNRDIHIIYFESNVATRIRRMSKRGSSDNQIIKRLLVDESFNWLRAIVELKHYAPDPTRWSVYHIHTVDADNDAEAVYHELLSIIAMIHSWSN